VHRRQTGGWEIEVRIEDTDLKENAELDVKVTAKKVAG
jgi:hypothetical protein